MAVGQTTRPRVLVVGVTAAAAMLLTQVGLARVDVEVAVPTRGVVTSVIVPLENLAPPDVVTVEIDVRANGATSVRELAPKDLEVSRARAAQHARWQVQSPATEEFVLGGRELRYVDRRVNVFSGPRLLDGGSTEPATDGSMTLLYDVQLTPVGFDPELAKAEASRQYGTEGTGTSSSISLMRWADDWAEISVLLKQPVMDADEIESLALANSRSAFEALMSHRGATVVTYDASPPVLRPWFPVHLRLTVTYS